VDFAKARDTMVESQVRTNDVTDRRLQTALRAVPREAFVPPDKAAFAYSEIAHAIPGARALWAPRDFAKLAQAAGVMDGDRVLVIAGASGYAAAVFAAMGAQVTILETADHADIARARLGAADVAASVISGGLSAPIAGGPYDVIFIDGAVETVPEVWAQALSEPGRLCVVVADGPIGKARLYARSPTGAAGYRIVFDSCPPKLRELDAAPAFTF
jgi:protein-L-isoaspartate(D-aspartate) O-methyltransferase